MGEWFGMPVGASDHAVAVDRVILIVHAVMAVAFVGWGAFFLVPVLKFRKSKHPNADYAGLKTRLPYLFVGILAIIEIVLLAGLSLPFWESEVNAAPGPDDDVVRVRIVAQQFQWNAQYPGRDGVFGRTAPEFVDEQLNPLGIDASDPAGKDDIATRGPFHFPVGKRVELMVSSKDVIHSFAVPEFRVKQDAIPGMSVPIRFTPTMTTADFRERVGREDRDFEVVCSQLCGLGHYNMRGVLIVDSVEEYDGWLQAEDEKRKAADADAEWFND